MTQRSNLIGNITVAAGGAGVGGAARLSAGGGGHNRLIAVTQRSNLIGNVAVAADRAGIHGITTLGAGGSGHYSLISMTQGSTLGCAANGAGLGYGAARVIPAMTSGLDNLGIAVTAGAGIGSAAHLSAGGSGHNRLIAVAGGGQSLGHFIAAAADIFLIAVLATGGSHVVSGKAGPLKAMILKIDLGTAVAHVPMLGLVPVRDLKHMSIGIRVVTNVAAAAGGAGVGGVALLGAGGSGHYGLIAVPQRIDRIGNIAVATGGAGVGGVATLSAGGSSHNGLMVVTQRTSLISLVAVAADGAGILSPAAADTARVDHDRLVVMTQRLTLCLAAAGAGLGFSAGGVVPCVGVAARDGDHAVDDVKVNVIISDIVYVFRIVGHRNVIVTGSCVFRHGERDCDINTIALSIGQETNPVQDLRINIQCLSGGEYLRSNWSPAGYLFNSPTDRVGELKFNRSNTWIVFHTNCDIHRFAGDSSRAADNESRFIFRRHGRERAQQHRKHQKQRDKHFALLHFESLPYKVFGYKHILLQKYSRISFNFNTIFSLFRKCYPNFFIFFG